LQEAYEGTGTNVREFRGIEDLRLVDWATPA
jgi:hypothetical protein